MPDYYQTLGLDSNADAAQIRGAYKRLAKLYHPDHNPGNKQSEEIFKEINEAYHVLSDPLKKSKYDSKSFSYYNTTESTDAYWREVQRKKKYYQNPAPHHRKARSYAYRFDRKYFRIQGLAFLVFIIISGLCFLMVHTAEFFVQEKQAKIRYMNSLFLKRVDTLFMQGNYKEAIQLIDTLSQHDPMEFRFYFRRDSLVQALRTVANDEFEHENYTRAAIHYKLLMLFESPMSFETLKRVASCEYNLGNFEESLQALKNLHHQQPNDIELIYQLGRISYEKLHQTDEALHYFTMGKNLFKKNMTDIYGEAYEIVMNPWDVPDIYFHVYEQRALANIDLSNYKDAITDCHWAIYLRPKNGRPYHLRALAKVKNNEFGGICSDWTKAEQLGFNDGKKLRQQYCH